MCESDDTSQRTFLTPDLLEASAASHARLCPRQVLGLRMGLLGGKALGLDLPRRDKRLLTIVETDGCMVSGISAATGCSVGRRTLYVMDYGKVAATLIDTLTGQAVRVAPRMSARQQASEYAPLAQSRWHAQLEGYQVMPDDELLSCQPVTLTFSLAELISVPGHRVTCEVCGEEIINEREVLRDGMTLCRPCAEGGYYALQAGEPEEWCACRKPVSAASERRGDQQP